MRKSFIKAAIVLGLSGAMSVNAFAMTFKDVQTTHWAYPSIQYMYEKNYMVPNSQGEFKPSATMDYFEVAEVLAKASGYQDELVVKDMDETLKAQIRKNYEAQKPILQKINGQYKTWRNSSNEEIAYLLGKGYLTEDELKLFMSVDKAGKEVKNIVKKEDLAVFLVRMMHKENTAKKDYKAGAFSDEAKMAEYKRPHVAYLKSIGLATGDAKGAFGAGTTVNKALVAKMSTDVLKKIDAENGSVTTPGTTTPDTSGMQTIKVNKIVTKNNTEKYVLVEFANGKTTFCTIKDTTEVSTTSGEKLTINEVAVNAEAKVLIEKVNGSDYITKMQLVTEGSNSGSSNGNNSGSTNTTNTTYSGEIVDISRNNVTLKISGKEESYPFSEDSTILLNGKDTSYRDIEIGDSVKVAVKNGEVTKLEATRSTSESTVSGKELKSKMEKRSEYILTLVDKNGDKEIPVPKDAKITRNGKSVDFIGLKTGDEIELTMKNGEVTHVEAEGKEQTIKGKVQAIHIAAQPQLTIDTGKEFVTVDVAAGADLYDKKARKEISIKEIVLFSDVTVDLDSKEIVALTVTDYIGKTTEKGTIKEVGQGARYIDVLIEYDKMTDTTMVVKRINVPSEVSVIINNREQYRNLLKEDMEVLITYDYGVSMNPKSIEVLR